MTDVPSIFKSSNYPETFDNDTNLFLVHDSLRVVLSEDYDPATDTTISVNGDTSGFPSTGIITLTEQCSDPKNRAISFYYTTVTASTFSGLIALPGFDNTIIRSKGITNVTLNVVAQHHNAIKDALIAIEKFIGIKGTIDTTPFGETILGRLNFLNKLILTPRAWFSSNKRMGLVSPGSPLEVVFTNESFRLGSGNITVLWDFGDEISTISIHGMSEISVSSVVPISTINVSVIELGLGPITKYYIAPGTYTVKLVVTNEFGSDTVVFEDFINARAEAPIPAVVDFNPASDQVYVPGTRILNGATIAGPWATPPYIKSRINEFISIFINTSSTYLNLEDGTQRDNAGEELNLSLVPIDPINEYIWTLTDDLTHSNESFTQAAYSIGGVYDLIVKASTAFGSYRITRFPGAIDIIENKNMFLFTLSGSTPKSYEFGLVSQEFKTGKTSTTNIVSNNAFLNGSSNETQAKLEFKRNVGFAPIGNVSSGFNVDSVIAYSSGGSSSDVTAQYIKFLDFNGFSGIFSSNSFTIHRPWNWLFFPFETQAFFLLGTEDANPQSSGSLTYQYEDTLVLGGTLSLGTGTALNIGNYINGAEELEFNPSSSGVPKWSTYRTTVQGNTGYFVRNNAVGVFYRIANFYRTEGTTTTPVINIRKLQDIGGQVKTEGELVALTSGIYFFNNSGSVSVFNTTTNTWQVLSISSNTFKTFQDTTISSYDNLSNTMVACSDGERSAYLSFDYSTNAFLQFNSIENTFFKLNPRPSGEQWFATIY